MLEKNLNNLISDYIKKRNLEKMAALSVSAPDIYNIKAEFCLENKKKIRISNISTKHLSLLSTFKFNLSEKSRDLFCPYPWDDEKKLNDALLSAINNSENKIDASFIIESNKNTVGHFFLWKAGGNPHSQKHKLEIPELGIAISDDYHGQGLGSLGVKFLQIVAHHINSDAIELTTAMSNDGGWHVYKKIGFEYTGDISNPLEVDVTEEIQDKNDNTKYRTERQMIHVINKAKKDIIINYLREKRNELQE